MIRRILSLTPIIVFVSLVVICSYRLVLMGHGNTPDIVPSAILGKTVPDFSLPGLEKNAPHTSADLKGKIVLINFFASWCETCQAEHPFLMTLAGKGVMMVGINYKDRVSQCEKYLAEQGNPYDLVVQDTNGLAAIDFGLYGVPESYLIDKKGIVRFKESGPLTPEIIRDRLLPLVRELSR